MMCVCVCMVRCLGHDVCGMPVWYIEIVQECNRYGDQCDLIKLWSRSWNKIFIKGYDFKTLEFGMKSSYFSHQQTVWYCPFQPSDDGDRAGTSWLPPRLPPQTALPCLSLEWVQEVVPSLLTLFCPCHLILLSQHLRVRINSSVNQPFT